MKTISHKRELGSGIYTASDISKLLHINQRKVSRYLNEFWDERLGRKLFNDTYSWNAGNRIKAVNFYVLIEFYSFFRLQEMGVKTRTILKARNQIAQELNVEYPFASAGLLSDGKKNLV